MTPEQIRSHYVAGTIRCQSALWQLRSKHGMSELNADEFLHAAAKDAIKRDRRIGGKEARAILSLLKGR